MDDNVSVRRLVADILSRAGHEVTQAGDRAAAGRVWRDIGLDLVILDLYMPEKDGSRLCGSSGRRAPAFRSL